MPGVNPRYIPFLTAGAVVGAILALREYPLVDQTAMLPALVVIFLAPLGATALVAMGSDTAARQAAFRKALLISSCAMVVMAAAIFCNGAMGRSEATEQKTFVVGKQVRHGKGGPSYRLTLES